LGKLKYDEYHISDNSVSLSNPNLLKQPEAGQFIRDLRQLTGLTQEQFGLRIGVSYETVSRWENGKMQPSSLAMKQLCQVLSDLGDEGTNLWNRYSANKNKRSST